MIEDATPVDAELTALLRRLGINVDPAELPMLADNVALLSHHWAIVRGDDEAQT
ncbi:hypothetical protein K3M67_21080 (plasmid) [Sphingobium sp. V4]|uniref:hypothetical protein n=1 Tax=Sphingobium sp. V4 TaxID=3038927 RepID=UPI002557CDF5|nr:hypothetical protein [Sphingobium sp. V4]WIW90504.1 hypothetical protein K3M67_21080 [Sphingobium sp. V4]